MHRLKYLIVKKKNKNGKISHVDDKQSQIMLFVVFMDPVWPVLKIRIKQSDGVNTRLFCLCCCQLFLVLVRVLSACIIHIFLQYDTSKFPCILAVTGHCTGWVFQDRFLNQHNRIDAWVLEYVLLSLGTWKLYTSSISVSVLTKFMKTRQ